MKEPHKKGLAIHLDPESCAGGRKATGEALTGAHTGQPLSSEIISTGVPTPCCEGEGHLQDGAIREPSGNAAESQTLSMCGNSMRENRKTPAVPLLSRRGRPKKASGRTSGMHAPGESDDLVVPANRANNAGPSAAAESVEGRRSREGTALFVDHVPDTAPEPTGRFGGRATARRLCLRRRSTQARSRMK
jgi:hypothetical protein